MKCAYESCTTELPEGHQFNMCDPCRALSNRNLIALRQDPASPFSDRHDLLFDKQLTQMSGEEILRWYEKLEADYHNAAKYIKLYQLAPSKSKAFKSLAEQVEETRATQRNNAAESEARRIQRNIEKNKKKRASKEEKLRDLGLDPSILDTEVDF